MGGRGSSISSRITGAAKYKKKPRTHIEKVQKTAGKISTLANAARTLVRAVGGKQIGRTLGKIGKYSGAVRTTIRMARKGYETISALRGKKHKTIRTRKQKVQPRKLDILSRRLAKANVGRRARARKLERREEKLQQQKALTKIHEARLRRQAKKKGGV